MSKILSQKRCSKCGETKLVSEFYKRKGRSGYLSICKTCRGKISIDIDKLKEYRKNHRLKYKALRNEQSKQWNRAHPEKHRQSNNKYQKNNPDVSRQITKNRRERKKNAGGTISKQEWLDVLEKYGNKCLCCGSREFIQMDHVVPLIVGGSNTIDNVQPLCRSCNSKKGIKVIDYR